MRAGVTRLALFEDTRVFINESGSLCGGTENVGVYIEVAPFTTFRRVPPILGNQHMREKKSAMIAISRAVAIALLSFSARSKTAPYLSPYLKG